MVTAIVGAHTGGFIILRLRTPLSRPPAYHPPPAQLRILVLIPRCLLFILRPPTRPICLLHRPLANPVSLRFATTPLNLPPRSPFYTFKTFYLSSHISHFLLYLSTTSPGSLLFISMSISIYLPLFLCRPNISSQTVSIILTQHPPASTSTIFIVATPYRFNPALSIFNPVFSVPSSLYVLFV